MTGQEWWLDYGNTQGRQRIFFRGNEMISIVVYGSRENIAGVEAERFLESLRCP